MIRLIAGYGFSEALAKGINILFSLGLTGFFDSNTYGVIALIISVEQVLIGVIVFSQEVVVLRSYNSFQGKHLQLYVSSSLIIALVVCGVLLLYGIYLLLPLSGWIQGITYYNLLMIIIGAAFQGLFKIHLSFFRGAENVLEYGVFRILYPIFKVISVIVMAVLIKAATAYPAGVLVANIALFLVLSLKHNRHIRHCAANFKKLIKSSWQYLKPSTHISVPLTLQSTIGLLYGVIDRFILQYFFDAQQVGIYFFAFLQGSVCIFVFDVLSLAFVPRIYHGEKYTHETASLLSKFLRVSVICICVLSPFIYFIVFPISLNFVSNVYSEGRIVVLLVLVSTIIDPIRLYGLYKLTFFRKVAMVPIISIVAFLLRLLCSFIFIPPYGIIGAAFAVVISVLLNGCITLCTAQIIQKKYAANSS